MKAEKMIQPQPHGTGSKKRREATEATHPVVESNHGLTGVDSGAWRYMIEREAYFRAKSRGFAGAVTRSRTDTKPRPK